MRGIVKRFPGVVANDGIDLSVRRGEIRCLLGENGAGKTTLMRILYGLYQPDEGEILLNGRPIKIRSPKEALTHRIGMVHQHFRLVPTLTVEENVILGLNEGTGPFLNLRKVRAKIKKISESYGLPVGTRARVDKLKAVMVDEKPLGKISVYDLIETRLNQMADPGVTFDPYQGPIYDRKGNLQVPAGMWLSVDSLITMEWAVDGVVGPWPGEPE